MFLLRLMGMLAKMAKVDGTMLWPDWFHADLDLGMDVAKCAGVCLTSSEQRIIEGWRNEVGGG